MRPHVLVAGLQVMALQRIAYDIHHTTCCSIIALGLTDALAIFATTFRPTSTVSTVCNIFARPTSLAFVHLVVCYVLLQLHLVTDRGSSR